MVTTKEIQQELKDIYLGKKSFNSRYEYFQRKNELKMQINEIFILRELDKMFYHCKTKEKFMKLFNKKTDNGLLGSLLYYNLLNKRLKKVLKIIIETDFDYNELRQNWWNENKEISDLTRKTIEETDAGIDLNKADNIKDLFKELEKEEKENE